MKSKNRLFTSDSEQGYLINHMAYGYWLTVTEIPLPTNLHYEKYHVIMVLR